LRGPATCRSAASSLSFGNKGALPFFTGTLIFTSVVFVGMWSILFDEMKGRMLLAAQQNNAGLAYCNCHY
jgi:hypothetical protein